MRLNFILADVIFGVFSVGKIRFLFFSALLLPPFLIGVFPINRVRIG